MCSFANSFVESPDFTPSVLHPLIFIELPIHILGAYVVVFKTPDKMSSIKWSMLLLHFWSALLDVLISSVTTPFITFPLPAGMFTGLLAVLGINKPFRMYIFVSVIASTVTSILGLFENRFNALNYKNQVSRKLRLLHIMMNYLLASTFMIPTLLVYPDQKEAISEARRQIPCLPSEVVNDPEFFVMTTEKPLFIYTTVIVSVIWCFQIFYFFFRILRFLSNRENISENTYKIQRKFYTALSVQLSIPMVFLLAPVLYMMFSFVTDYFNQSLNNVIFVMIAFHGLVSTCVMLSVHSPYRRCIRKMMCFSEEMSIDPNKRMSLVVSL